MLATGYGVLENSQIGCLQKLSVADAVTGRLEIVLNGSRKETRGMSVP